VASVESVVKVGDAVKVRVLSLDAATGKIALTMKSASESRARANDDDEVEEEEEDVDEQILSFAEEDDLEPDEGHEFVFADTVADYDLPFQMTEEDAELTVAAVNEFEDNDAELEVETELDIPVPLNELVTCTVERVEDYGAFVSFLYNGNQFRGFLERDEAKIPASALSAEELAEFTSDGLTPEYVDADFDDMKQYYKTGDLVHAFILEHNERGEINLTQFTDVEVEDDGLDIEDADGFDEDGPISDQPLSMLTNPTGIAGIDVLIYDPEDLLEEEVAGDSPSAADGSSVALSASDDAVMDYKVYGQGPVGASLFTRSGVIVPSVNFPDRPLSKIDGFNLNTIGTVDRDFDGDEIHLEDLWQDSIPVPK
jgi:predicted RNA-binding protein with RPS1 domain